jgi:1-acyl-sn-glycerol-3-phosphate acyltransferase
MVNFLGWAMQHAAYLFLDRVWEKDQETITNISGYYKSCQSPLSVSIYKLVFYSIFKKK